MGADAANGLLNPLTRGRGALLPALREALPPEIESAIRDAQARAGEDIDRAIGLVTRRIDQLGRTILAQLVTEPPDRLGTRITGLVRLLESLTLEAIRTLVADVQDAQTRAVASGQALFDEPLRASGIEIFQSDVSLPLLDTLKGFSADKITSVGRDIIERITTELRLVALGGKDFNAAMQEVARIVPPLTARTSTTNRAEAIVRTEVGRVHSMTTQRRMEQAGPDVPGLMKEWRHSGNLRNPRSGHQAMNGTRVPFDQPFQVAPVIGASREAMMHPRDPRASARNTVHCRCNVLPFLPQWETG